MYMIVYLYMYMHMYIFMNMYAYMLLRSTTQYYVVIFQDSVCKGFSWVQLSIKEGLEVLHPRRCVGL